MRIKQISITKLFGIFDHKIPLNIDDHITIIHGPNGYGKTVLLEMIDGLFRANYSIFNRIPFEQFEVKLTGDRKVTVKKSLNQDKDDEKLLLTFPESSTHRAKTFQIKYPSRIQSPRLRHILSILDDIIPELDRVGPVNWLHAPTGEVLDLTETIERFRERIPEELYKNLSPVEEPKEFTELRRQISTRLIRAQRLIKPVRSRRGTGIIFGVDNEGSELDSDNMSSAVVSYSRELTQIIKAKLTSYGELSQTLDRTFPGRVIQQDIVPNVTYDELLKELENLERERVRLMNVGLIDRTDLEVPVPESIEDETRKNLLTSVLSVYVKDTKEKLNVFSDIADKIDLFIYILERRFKYKKLAVSKDEGFTLQTSSGDQLSLTALSSGEQHELVLLYELLFKVEPNSLILIDEPELSLHIAWQQEFLKDLQEVIKLAGFDTLIATHSPEIIFDHWDLTVRLKGPGE